MLYWCAWNSGVPRGVWGFKPPPRNPKVLTKSKRIANWAENVAHSCSNVLISLKIAEFRTPAPQDIRKKGSKILKLPSFAIVLHLQWQIIWLSPWSLKALRIKKILLYEMELLVPNYSCLQNPWLGGYHPQIPVLSDLYLQLKLLNRHPPPPPNKIPGYATGMKCTYSKLKGHLNKRRVLRPFAS